MLGLHAQVWVTSALCDQDVQKALVLCYSLRRVYTTRKIAVIASPKISGELRQALNYGFDYVFFFEEDQNKASLKLEDFAKLYCLVALRSYTKCAYLSPSMMALRNCDDIFAEETNEFLLLENAADTSVFLFQPSMKHFEVLMAGLRSYEKNGSGMGAYLNMWMKNQYNRIESLHDRYNVIMKPEKALLGFEDDISLVNLVEYPNRSDIEKLESTGILGKLVSIHWLKIQRNDVLPLLEHSLKIVPSSANEPFTTRYDKEPIAVVGMSCRFPGSNNLEEFWDLLFQGQDGTCNPPPFRWLREQCSRHIPDARKTNAGFLKVPVDEFDGKFFGISPTEVCFMDPQHRLLHELVWEGLEDACLDPHTLRGTSSSVWMGSWLKDYKDILMESREAEFYRVYMGNSIGAAAARISFLLGMTGPSIATESGCSSAMVAVHMACRSLQLGETNLALACGVNMLLHPFNQDEMPMVISPDGHSKTFSEDANGFARAEGAGVLVLKRLSDALKDGDHIWGLIRGSAVSQEGVSKSMGTPTVHCESLAMTEALADARVTPDEVTYVEAHGTGTIVGDPMEVAAIAKAYNSPNRKEPLVIGSVKTNVGHTESCSGITGIMKVILAMQHEIIPAHRNFTKLNPTIDLNAVPAIIPLESMEWKKVNGKPRVAGVSSFGITGTDAHVIVEEPPQLPLSRVLTLDGQMERPLHILKLSAKTEEAMNFLLEKYKDAIKVSNDSIADITFSANTGRANFPIRTAIIAKSKEEICTAIEQQKYLKGETSGENAGKICFLFTGQGSQYQGMTFTLYETSPVFRMHFDYCEKTLNNLYGISIKDVLWLSNSSSDISRTIYSQTSIFCVEYALLKLWESWGLQPDYVLGHSLGEFAAAVCAGILTCEDALKLVAERSRLIDELPRGKMLVIKADRALVDKAMKKFAGGDKHKILDYAAVNSSQQTVVAGDSDEVIAFGEFCKENKMKCIILDATHAFHSKHMDPILDEYMKVAKTVEKQNASLERCGYISGMKGDVVPGTNVDADYWVQHTREKVNFLNASKKAVELGCQIFIEIGPQPVLSALTMMNNDVSLVCVPSLKKTEDEWTTLLTTLAKLYIKGVEINWNGFDQFLSRNKVRLPHYPFIGKKVWPDLLQTTGNVIHPLIGSIIPNASSAKLFQCGVNLKSHEYIKDHAIGRHAIFPGAGYLEMCLAAGYATVQSSTDSLGKPSRSMKVENLNIAAPLCVEESKSTQIQTVVEFNTDKDNNGDWNDLSIKIFHRVGADSVTSWLSHANATFTPIPTAEDQVVSFDLARFQEMISQPSDDEIPLQLYEKLATLGLKFGPMFRSIEKLWKENDTNRLLAKVKVPFEDAQYNQHIIHPVVLDAMIQAIMMLKLSRNLKRKLYVPIKIGKFVWLSNISEEATAEVYIQAFEVTNGNATDTTNCSALLLDSTGKVLAVMSSVEFIDTTVRAVESVLEQQTSSMPDLWEEIWRPKIGPAQHTVNLDFFKATTKIMDNNYENDLKHYNNNPELKKTFEQLEKLVYYNMLKAMYECGWEPNANQIISETDLFEKLKIEKRLWKQCQYFLLVFEEEGILQRQDRDKGTWKVVGIPPSSKQILDELATSRYSSELIQKFRSTLMLMKIGDYLGGILKGSQSALSILFPEESSKKNEETTTVAEFYTEYGMLLQFQPLMTQLTDAWFKDYKLNAEAAGLTRSVFRILEIGAGTGVYTRPLLETLDNNDIEYEYTYTDISSAFFPAAEKKFEKFLKNMKFRKLNIEEDPVSQGFVPSYYDIVSASDVIHATRELKETLTNVRTLLKPNGFFDMCEMTKVNRFVTYMFGLLDGFWRFEDFDVRPNHCTLSKSSWKQVLHSNGLDLVGAYSCANDHNANLKSVKVPFNDRDTVSANINKSENDKTWLVFHQENHQLSNYLAEKIPELAINRKIVLVTRGNKFGNSLPNEFLVRQDIEEDFVQLMDEVNSRPGTVEGILYSWSLDGSRTEQEEILRPYFYLTKSLDHLKQASPPKLIALTRGSIPVEEGSMSHCYASTIWGFTKSLKNENSALQCKCVDIGSQSIREIDMMQIFYELWSPEKEAQVAYHANCRFIPKFTPHKPSIKDLELPIGAGRFHLIMPETKSISDLKFAPFDPSDLEQGELEVQVKSSALNFRDIFSVLKPTDKFKDINAIGFDFAGIVKRIHPKVTKWQVGDKVYGINLVNAGLPSHIKLHQDDVLPVPDRFTLSEACTLPAVVTTSYHSLVEVANIKPSDIVLIHAATGGVGLSAIEICKHIGATIIATAGSKRKQNYLQTLGIKHIFHSRNTEYGDQILKVTNGHGVDVVLNSLTSEGFKEASLKACAPGARFIELSKLSIWEPEEVKQLRPDIDYTIVDMSAKDVVTYRKLLGIMQDLIDRNIIHPLPYEQFNGTNVREALQFMQKAKHIGKVVCILPEVRQRHGKTEVYTPMFNDRSTYLITGGLGGIGFECCKWMVKLGAKHILLAGRNAPNASMQAAIGQVNSEYGADVRSVQLDVSNFEQCRELIQKKLGELKLPKLRGIMHAAGILADGLIANLNWEKLRSTFNTKVNGTLNLHQLTKDLNLEHFVLFSSIASLLGSPGQCNHAAGNNFEDAFAAYRHSVGLPAVSVNWGQWAEVGIATEVELPGLRPLSNLQGVTALEYILKSHRTQTCVLNVESMVILSKLFPQASVYFDERVWKSGTSGSSGSQALNSEEFWQQYDSAQDVEQKTDVIRTKLCIILRSILKLDETDELTDDTNFQEAGVDSLMFVEIKNTLQTLLGDRITLNASAVRDCDTVGLLSRTLVKLIEGDEDINSEDVPTLEEVKALIKEDIYLPESIMAKPGQITTPVPEISCVLLTGSTGTLGPYVLQELSKRKQITEILCLIRSRKNISGQERLNNILTERDLKNKVDMSKVRCVEGNVASPHMGMEPIVWEELCNKVDAVFHCAASVQHIEQYRKRKSDKDMRAVNVQGTKNVLEFACTGGKLKHVYLASSLLGVTTADADGNFSENWPEPHDYDDVMTMAYPITKFVGDMLMKQAILERGIPGKSFRFPLIVGDSESGRFVLSQNHVMLRYFFILKTGMMPSNPFPIPMLSVDTCSWASVQLFLDPNVKDDVYNISNVTPDADQEFTRVAKKLGFNVDIVEFSEFAQKIRESSTDDNPFSMFKDFYRNDEDLMAIYTKAPVLRQYVLEGGSNKDFMVSKKIRNYLPEFYQNPCSSMDHIYRDMLFARNEGWLDKYTV